MSYYFKLFSQSYVSEFLNPPDMQMFCEQLQGVAYQVDQARYKYFFSKTL